MYVNNLSWYKHAHTNITITNSRNNKRALKEIKYLANYLYEL